MSKDTLNVSQKVLRNLLWPITCRFVTGAEYLFLAPVSTLRGRGAAFTRGSIDLDGYLMGEKPQMPPMAVR